MGFGFFFFPLTIIWLNLFWKTDILDHFLFFIMNLKYFNVLYLVKHFNSGTMSLKILSFISF